MVRISHCDALWIMSLILGVISLATLKIRWCHQKITSSLKTQLPLKTLPVSPYCKRAIWLTQVTTRPNFGCRPGRPFLCERLKTTSERDYHRWSSRFTREVAYTSQPLSELLKLAWLLIYWFWALQSSGTSDPSTGFKRREIGLEMTSAQTFSLPAYPSRWK